MARQRTRKRPISDINVVPYIDVMLVLLVIFMITAPLLVQGVKVELPKISAEPIKQQEKEPIIVTVDADGNYSLNVGDKPNKSISGQTLMTTVAALIRLQPETPVLVRGDKNAKYGTVVIAMSLLQKAGVPNVGLITKTPKTTRKRR